MAENFKFTPRQHGDGSLAIQEDGALEYEMTLDPTKIIPELTRFLDETFHDKFNNEQEDMIACHAARLGGVITLLFDVDPRIKDEFEALANEKLASFAKPEAIDAVTPELEF